MNKIKFALIACCTLLLQACPASCADEEVFIDICNETNDTCYISYTLDFVTPPSYAIAILEILPQAIVHQGPLSSGDLKDHKLTLWVVRKEILDKYGADSVVEKRLFDFVRAYTWGDLETCNFKIKIEDSLQKNI